MLTMDKQKKLDQEQTVDFKDHWLTSRHVSTSIVLPSNRATREGGNQGKAPWAVCHVYGNNSMFT